MRGIIAIRFVFKIGMNGALTALGSAILPSAAFGFNRYAMDTFISSHPAGMLDRRLPQLKAVKSDLDADDTPPVVSMSPNQKGATEHFAPLDAIMGEEVGRGWISEGREHPHCLPAQSRPSSACQDLDRTSSERSGTTATQETARPPRRSAPSLYPPTQTVALGRSLCRRGATRSKLARWLASMPGQ